MCEEEETFEQRFNRLAKPLFQKNYKLDDGEEEVRNLSAFVVIKINKTRSLVLRKSMNTYERCIDYKTFSVDQYKIQCDLPDCIGHHFVQVLDGWNFSPKNHEERQDHWEFYKFIYNNTDCSNPLMCPICLDTFPTSKIKLSCKNGHYLCKTCFKNCMAKQPYSMAKREKKCPCCREVLDWPDCCLELGSNKICYSHRLITV